MRGKDQDGREREVSTLINDPFDVLRMPIGYTPRTGAFTLPNDRDFPCIMLRDIYFNLWTHVQSSSASDTTAAFQTAVSQDYIGKAIQDEFSPLFRNYMTRMQPFSGVGVGYKNFAYVYQAAETYYALACHIMAKRYMYKDFDWSSVPPLLPGRPPSITADAELWKVDDVNFDITWGPLLNRIARLPIMPRVREQIRVLYQPFAIDTHDSIVRQFTYKQWDIASEADLTTLVATVKADLTLIETGGATVQALNWLLQYLPHRCGIPEMSFIGVSDFHAFLWWNGGTDLFQTVNPAGVESNEFAAAVGPRSVDALSFIDPTQLASNLANLIQYNSDTGILVAAWGGVVDMEQVSLLPVYEYELWDVVESEWLILHRSLTRMGPPMVIEDGTNDLIQLYGIPIQFNNAGFDDEIVQYGNIAESRHVFDIPATLAIDDSWDGLHHPQMVHTRIGEDAFNALMPLRTLQLLMSDEFSVLDAESAGARASTPRKELADTYKRYDK